MREIILASTNDGKIKEFNDIFSSLNIKVIPMASLNVPEIEEPFTTFIENALNKARICSKYTKLPVLADDSGLCVPSLNGEPGIYSARYAGNSRDRQKNCEKLTKNLENQANRSAYFYCVLVLLKHQFDPAPLIATGVLWGSITFEPRGTNGFGYDPYFYVESLRQTLAQMGPTQKNLISHRAIAIKNLIDQIKHSKI